MMEAGDLVRVKRGYGTACDGMEGVVARMEDFFSVAVRFDSGEVILPVDSLEKI